MNEESKKILADLTPEERESAMSILMEIADKGKSQTLNNMYMRDYDEIPVNIDTFIEDSNYIGQFTGNGTLIYPYWRQRLREMFEDENQFQEVALTGSIGIGKSTIACIAMAYLLYKTMCLKNPQEYFRLAAGSTIVFAFFNNTLDLTTSVGYGTIQNMVQNSPWFLKRGTVSGTKNKEYIPDKLIRFRVGSQASHALGTNIISAMIDEVNFKQGANVRMEQSKIMETYNGVLERMGSRFMVNGKIAGKLFIVSSKKSEYDFLESYIRKKANDPSVMVCDAKLWEVKPMGTYSGKTFKVAVGGSNLPSKIVEDGEDINYLMERGYEIIEPPVEFKGRFEMDINAALMNIAGISISHVTKFIPYTIIEQCYNDSKNPFTQPILEIGLHDQLRIRDFFIPELVSSQIYSRKLFIHIDASLTGDKTGIGCVAVMGFRDQDRYDDKSGNVMRLKEFVYKHVFSVDIKAPKGSEISFQKTREFIYYLKYILNWNICGVSLDGFQSADCRQQLETAGFNATIVSLDRSPNGYMAFRSALAEKRISMIKIPFLETEIIRLERDNMTGKIDHPLDGSKDMSDGLAGSLYNASISVDPEEMYSMEDYSVVMDVNPVTPIDISDNPANEMFDFIPRTNPIDNYIETDPLQETVNKDIKQQDTIVKQLRDKLSKSENRNVSDDELLGALFNRDDNIIIF